MAKKKSSKDGGWRNRIVGHGEVDPRTLKANPLNWRRHPEEQKSACCGAANSHISCYIHGMAWLTTSRHSRGYGATWDKQRKRILARDNGLCQPCLKHGRIHAGTEVDHVVSRAIARARGWTKAETESDENLQAINTQCHKLKTDAEQGRSSKPKATIGLDGYPVDD